MDDQLSKSNVNGKEESFVWDDLALIQRNNTELTNEPYVTGGNPIMAGDKTLFNDMLGSTLGVAANGSYTPINRTSFGEVDNAASHDYNFFTGKPNVEGLGYSFLFRNYNANNGKWTAQDPLGYPDGWNNTAYCGNRITNCVDFDGGALQEVGSYNGTVVGASLTSLDLSVSVAYQDSDIWPGETETVITIVANFKYTVQINWQATTVYCSYEHCPGHTIGSNYTEYAPFIATLGYFKILRGEITGSDLEDAISTFKDAVRQDVNEYVAYEGRTRTVTATVWYTPCNE